MTEWAPFGLDEDQTEQYRVLRDGVPGDLREPMLGWLKPLLSSGVYRSIINERTQELAMLTGLQIGLRDGAYADWDKYVQALRGMEEFSFLRLIDGALSLEWSGKRVGELDRLLRLGRSKWTVGERAGRAGLVSREPEGVQDMVEGTIASAGTAGQMLSRAWGKVHALTPDDTGAYADAVRAVEAAAQPLVEPTNREATLGGIANVMRSQGDWRLTLREHQHAPTGEMIVAMLRSLYRGHIDRHGSDDYRDVTHEEAGAGVALAATLVSWFSSGAVQRRPAESG